MIRVGVAGVGHLGQHHARIFSGLSSCQMMGIFDSNPVRAGEIAVKFGLKTFPTFEALLADIDAVDISVTTTFHYELAKKALLAGKHVFIEKPITSELEQGQELVAIAREKGLKLQVGHIERFNPVVMAVIEQIGDPMFIESHRLAPFQPRGSDVPVILDLMIHDIDLILSFVHSEISDIRASGVSILTPSIDIANARIEFTNGAIANVTSSRVSLKQERKLRLFQKDAYVSMDFKDKKVSVLRKSANIAAILPKLLMGSKDVNPTDLVDITEVDASNHVKDALTMELESFLHAIEAGRNPVVDGEAGLRALQVAFRIMEQIRSTNPTLAKSFHV